MSGYNRSCEDNMSSAQARFEARMKDKPTTAETTAAALDDQAEARILESTCAQARCVLHLHGTQAERRAVKAMMKKHELTTANARNFVAAILNDARRR